MIDRDTIFSTLRDARSELENRGVQSLAVFGSVARGTFSEGSDLDVLVEFNRPVGLFEFLRLKFYLEQVLGCRVDLVTPDALRAELREQILEEAIDVHE